MKLQKSPLFLVALSFAAGIALSSQFSSPTIWGLIALSLAACGLFLAARKRIWPRAEQTLRLSVGLCFVFAGWVMGEVADVIPSNDPFHHLAETVTVTGAILDTPRPTKSGYRAVLQCEAPYQGKIMLFISNTQAAPKINERIQTTIEISEIRTQYDAYRAYLHHQGVYTSAKVQAFQTIGQASGIMAFFGELRSSLGTKMAESFPDPETAGLSRAMLLGDRSGLDFETKKDFAATGLSHIIAISGMHLAIIYMVLCFLLSPMLQIRGGRQMRSILLVLLLAAFTLLAGASPAILRAAFMLSLLELGRAFWQKSNSLNALAASALLFLTFDPQSLFSPDFQLSYAAVLGILLFQNPILHYFHKRLKWMPARISSALAVTLAAQLATTPLVAWHFQSFPTYFLFANLLVLPLVTVAVQFGFLGFLLVWIPGLNTLWAGIMDFLLWSISFSANLMAQIPGATISKITLSETGIWMLVLQAATFLILLEYRFIQRAWRYLFVKSNTHALRVARTGLQFRVMVLPIILIWVFIGFLLA